MLLSTSMPISPFVDIEPDSDDAEFLSDDMSSEHELEKEPNVASSPDHKAQESCTANQVAGDASSSPRTPLIEGSVFKSASGVMVEAAAPTVNAEKTVAVQAENGVKSPAFTAK